MDLKALLLCSGNDELLQHQSVLGTINALNSPKKYIRKLGGLPPIHSKHRRRVQGLMWGARGAFPLAAAMFVAVVAPVVFCAKATEKRNKNTKISCLLAKKNYNNKNIL